MQEFMESALALRFTAYAEPTDDGVLFAGYTPSGRYVQADSLAALALYVDEEAARPRPQSQPLRMVA